MESNTKSGGTEQTGSSTNLLPSEKEESNGETYKIYPGAPFFAEGMVRHFEDVSGDDKKWIFLSKTYTAIENLIIEWNNDGTKTAGRLARRICKMLQDEQKGKTG